MPSARPPWSVPEGKTTRDMPPASPELRAASSVTYRRDKARRRAHPCTSAPLTPEKRDLVAKTTVELMDIKTPSEIAAIVGVSVTDPRPVKAVILSAREALQRRAEFYVEAHARGTAVAAEEGDTKPSQWALERIAEGDARIVDEPTKAPTVAPTFNLGFAIGGVPMAPRQTIDTKEHLPVLEGAVDTP